MSSSHSSSNSVNYNYDIVKLFTLASTFWGIVGFLVGVYIAFELAFPILNLDIEWMAFGRLRPLHTSSVIFAFGLSRFSAFDLLISLTPSLLGVAGHRSARETECQP